MITHDELVASGYKKYPPDRISHPYSDCFYQKRVRDGSGIRYFVDICHYGRHKFSNGYDAQESWMVELNNNEPHMTFTLHQVTSLAEAEAKCELFWRTMGCEYYEKD